MQVDNVFAEADRLSAQRKQRSTAYLSSLSDEELARVVALVTAPQQVAPDGDRLREAAALKKVQNDRLSVIKELLKWATPLGEDEGKVFGTRYAGLVVALADMGPSAVPAISMRMGQVHLGTNHWTLARQALLKMGPGAIGPLTSLLDDKDERLRENGADVLSQLAGPSAKEVLLRAADNESGGVRRYALAGLNRLGPKVIGEKELIAIMVDHLEDGLCLSESIQGLERYGDETAIEPLRVIEQFCPVSRWDKKGNWSYLAHRAINAILKRAGKPFKEIPPAEYAQRDSTYDELCAAAQCPNAAIRSSAIVSLEEHRADRTARFLIERLRLEKRPTLLQVIQSLGMVALKPKGASEPGLSAEVVQEVFDALLAAAQTDAPQDADQKAAAISATGTVLHAARERGIGLAGVDTFKAVILGSLSEDCEAVRAACYQGCTGVGMAYPPVGDGWLAHEREQIVEQLAPMLSSPNPPFRLIECLGFVGDRRLTPRLVELLGHSEEPVRRFAASALGQIGDPNALPALSRLADTDPHQYENGVYGVREAALQAIRQINGVKPVNVQRAMEANMKPEWGD